MERFMARVNKNGPIAKNRPDLGPCWVWAGATNRGYGAFRIGPRTVQAHRWIYLETVGPIAPKHELDHFACDGGSSGCVNPAHVRPVTPRENNMRSTSTAALNAVKTHCKHGHPFDEVNTYRYHGKRMCKQCGRDRRRAKAGH